LTLAVGVICAHLLNTGISVNLPESLMTSQE